MNRRLCPIRLAAVFAAFGLLALRMHGQAAPDASHLAAGPTYTSSDGKSSPKFPNVDVVFSLTAPDGSPMQAKPGDLQLFFQGKEAGTATSIRTFEQAGYGVTAILALDASGSMKGAPLRAVHASISKFVNQARSQDRVEVLTFADQTQVDVPFGAEKTSLTKELETVQARGSYTRLYDGLLQTLDQFNDSQPKRRQIVIISDGHDEGSKPENTIEKVIAKAKYLSVVIDSIGLTKDNGQYLVSLQQLSNQTGGTYVRAHSPQELEGLIDQGIKATRATPVAAFKTSHLPTDGKNQTVQLRWQQGKLTAPAFIVTPKISAAVNLWIWILGGCFVAGVILLALSWRGARRRAMPVSMPVAAATSGMGQQFMPEPMPPYDPTPVFSDPALIQSSRTPTVDEGAPRFEPYPASQENRATPAYEPARTPIPSSERGKTQLAVFWDAPEHGAFAHLRITSGELAGQTVAVTTAYFSIGAVEGNLLVLPGDPTISGQHARLLWENAVLKIEDNKSTNGTYVNGIRLEPGRHLLRPGDRIRIGQTLLLLERA
jgi:Mg-chelatase subunit ChlD